MKIIIGTSGWMYRHWNGVFYPPEVRGKDQLAYFATQFRTVEINTTFYHLPLASSVERWAEVAPKNFRYAIKCNRILSHYKRLQIDDDAQRVLDEFVTSLRVLGPKMAVMLVQLPPSLRVDHPRLEAFLTTLRQALDAADLTASVAIEFRHKSWFEPATWELLRRLNVAHVVIDSPGRWPAARQVTADTAYFRFHGHTQLYRSSYSDDELSEWLDYIAEAASDCRAVYAYFNNDFEATAIANARSMVELARGRGWDVA